MAGAGLASVSMLVTTNCADPAYSTMESSRISA